MEVKINKFDYFGRGIGKINEKIIFVPKTLPGEIVDIKIVKEKKNYYEGQLNNVVTASDARINPICPYYDDCGGCSFLHTIETVEKDYKILKAKELLGRCDSFYETNNLNYRNKVTLHVKNNKIGFYQEKTNDIINIKYCHLLNNNLNKVISDLNQVDLSKYNFKNIIIKTNLDKLLLDVDNDVDNKFVSYFPYVDTIISNGKITKGIGYLNEVIEDYIFKITPNAFFQVNKDGLNNIYLIIKRFLDGKKINKALDLYSGISLWGILISNYVKKVVSIEINKEACLNAKDNLEKNNIHNVKIINGDVKDYIDSFQDIDLVIVDPPRSGLDKKTRKYLQIINSYYLIYISCNMQTLKRDLDELKEKYNIQSINLVDMFKRTYHCESIVILERKK